MSNLSSSRRNLLAAGVALTTALAARVVSAERRHDNDRRPDRDEHCFRAGTRLQVVDGMCAVEDLATDDKMATTDGILMPVVRKHLMSPSGGVVLISAGAIRLGIPYKDLYLSAQHCLLFGDRLIAAGNLVNGRTIRFVEDEERYYHVELDQHVVLFAEGVECESLLMPGQIARALIVPYNSRGRDVFKSRLRSAISPVYDIRRPEEVVRDRLAA